MLLKELANNTYRHVKGDAIRIGDKTFRKARVDRNEELVLLDRDFLEDKWANDQLYIGHGPTYQNHIGNRIENFKEFYENNDDIEVGNVHVSKRRNVISFGDGRHRTRVLLEKGYDMIPLTMTKEALRNLKEMA